MIHSSKITSPWNTHGFHESFQSRSCFCNVWRAQWTLAHSQLPCFNFSAVKAAVFCVTLLWPCIIDHCLVPSRHTTLSNQSLHGENPQKHNKSYCTYFCIFMMYQQNKAIHTIHDTLNVLCIVLDVFLHGGPSSHLKNKSGIYLISQLLLLDCSEIRSQRANWHYLNNVHLKMISHCLKLCSGLIPD